MNLKFRAKNERIIRILMHRFLPKFEYSREKFNFSEKIDNLNFRGKNEQIIVIHVRI